MVNKIEYGYDELLGPNDVGLKHGMGVVRPYPSEYGEWVLVGYDHSSEEQHHQVQLIDEDGDPIMGVWVIFGYPGGDGKDYSHLIPMINHWRGSPQVLRGNAVKSDGSGTAKHTTGSGGEDIWVWDVQENAAGVKVLELPSVVVRNNRILNIGGGGTNEHTGAKLTFQRRLAGVVPKAARLEDLERRMSIIEKHVLSN